MIKDSIRSYNNLIQIDSDGVVYVNREATEYSSLEEARTYIKNKQVSNTLETQITKDVYEEITDNRIASIIKEYHDVKVTDTLIESYIELASSQIFTIDPIVQKIRSLNKLDAVIEGKLHYQLSDGSVVAINERTQKRLNNLLNKQKEIVDYMRESKEHFFHVLQQIEEN